MLAATANIVAVVLVVASVTIAVVIVPIAVIALAFMLHHPLVLLLRRLVVSCCFPSVAGIFATRPSFG